MCRQFGEEETPVRSSSPPNRQLPRRTKTSVRGKKFLRQSRLTTSPEDTMRYLLLVVITLLCVALVTSIGPRRTPPRRTPPRRSVRMRTSVPTHAPHPQTRQPLHGHHPTCQDLPNGTYPDLEDCTKFYMCSNGISSSFSCPDGLFFDIKTLRCEWPEEATCATSVKEKKRTPAPLPTKKIYSSVNEFSCKGLPDGNYPDPEDCSRYYSCSNGNAYLMSCPNELHYNEKTDQCDYPANVNCGCTVGYEHHGRNCYKAFNDEKSYEKAAATCLNEGGSLAMPRDESTHEFLIALKNKVDNYHTFWLGINRREGGKFEYYDGTSLSFQAWYPGEPNNVGGQEDCVMMYGVSRNNMWNDIPCFGPQERIICQISLRGASVKRKARTPVPLPGKNMYRSAISYDTVTIKTSPTHDSQSGDRLTVEIFSDVCDDVCATTAIDGLAQAGTEYKHSFGASDFGDPTMISLTTSGDDQLILDWVEVYNGETKKFYHFSCPSNGCRLSTDPKEGDQQVVLDVDAHHTLTLRTSATRDSKSSDSLTVSIYSDVCDNVCKTMVFSGHTEDGTEYEHPFPAPDFGDPTVIRLQISGNDELILDWVEVFNVYTGKYYRFPCPSNGCHLSKDNAEANWQMFLHVDV